LSDFVHLTEYCSPIIGNPSSRPELYTNTTVKFPEYHDPADLMQLKFKTRRTAQHSVTNR